MLKSFGEVPFGVWCGAAIIIAAAWMKDGWGFVLGILIIGFTTFTTSYAKKRAEQEARAANPEDDGWGAEAQPSDSPES